jgi:hypothetical protein
MAADSRTEFLQLLDRPRVPLAAQASELVAAEALIQIAFSYATEAGERVPGILLKTASSIGRRPAVVAMHGTGGNKDTQLAFLLSPAAGSQWLRRRRNRRSPSWRALQGGQRLGRVRRRLRVHSPCFCNTWCMYVGAILRAFREGKGKPFFFDTAWDIMRLVDYLETRSDVDQKRIGLFGVSKGGIETYLAAAADPRIAVAVPCIAIESFRWAVEHDSWQSRIGTVQAAFDAAARDSGVANPGAEFVRTFYSKVAPGIDGKFDGPAMVPLIAPRPLLSINGDIDLRTPLLGVQLCADVTRAAYRATGAEEKFVLRIQPKTGHQVLPESLDASLAWFVRWLEP